jgi:hypothetical protein
MHSQSRFRPQQRASPRVANRVNPSPGTRLAILTSCQALSTVHFPQITQAVSSDTFERLVSQTIFWSYCVMAPPAMVGYALLAMLIIKL